MSDVEPRKINEIREQFGWSAGDLGHFLGRTKATIYYWESGENSPGETMSALLDCLFREMEIRKQAMSAQEFEKWVGELKDKQVSGFLRELQTDRALNASTDLRADPLPGQELRVMTDQASRPVLCLIPCERGEFERLVDLLSEKPQPAKGLAELLLDSTGNGSSSDAEVSPSLPRS